MKSRSEEDMRAYRFMMGMWGAYRIPLVLPPFLYDRIMAVVYGPIPAVRSALIPVSHGRK